MTTINGVGNYCCLCFIELNDSNITIINNEKWDSCIPCETEHQRKCRQVILNLRNKVHELELKVQKYDN